MDSRRSALVLENARPRRSLLTELIQEQGFPIVIEATSTANALEMIDLVHFDIVFVEIDATSDGGLSFVRDLRRDQRRAHRMPLVAVSSDLRASTIQAARDAGASGFLAKPFSNAALKMQIKRALNDTRPFIEARTFVGPDRRRWVDPSYSGPERRTSDKTSADQDATNEAWVD